MKVFIPISFFFGFIFSLPGASQTAAIDSLLQQIHHGNGDSNEVIALRALSMEYWKLSKTNAALEYHQRAFALNDELKLQYEIAEVKKDFNSFTNGSPSVKQSIHDTPKEPITTKEFSQRISQIEADLKSLEAAIAEYNRRSFSLADDEVSTARRESEQLTLRQQAALQHFNDERTRRNWILGGAITVVALVSLVFFQINRRRQTKNKLEINQLNNKVLRAQLNPHFIFNALNSIRNYITLHPDLADDYLLKFSILMRQVLENSVEEKISLNEEIAMIENYMQLETLRVQNGFDYEVSVAPSIDAANTMVPPLILQPMIENAIWHGLDPLPRRGKIVLRFTEKDNLLEAVVEDNGIGIGSTTVETKSAKKTRSLGLQITKQRIELLNKKARVKGWLEQQLFETGSEVRIAIPV